MALILIEIRFSKYTSHQQLVADLTTAFDAQPGDEAHLIIDLHGPYNLIYADFLLLVISLINHLKQRGIKVSGRVLANEHDDKVKYASRVNFFQQLGINFPESFTRHSGTGKFTEITQFDKDNIYRLQDQLGLILHNNTDISKEVLQLLYYCLNEIMDNVLVHSNQETGWLFAQFFPNKKEIRLIICDTGIGIHQSLTHYPNSRYAHLSAHDALGLCTQRGVTNGAGLGFGLYATHQFLKENKGTLLVYSGNHSLQVIGPHHQVTEVPKWKGTFVFLKINTQVAVDYKLVLPEGHHLPNDYEEFIQKHLGIDDNLW